MRSEYDFSRAVRGKYYRRYLESSNVVVIEPDVHRKFKNSAAVNDALRTLIRAAGKGRGLTKRRAPVAADVRRLESMSFAADFQQEAKRQSDRGRCLHFTDGARCNEIISAHSIQKSGQLSLIAEDGHVYRLNADLSTLKKNNGRPQPKKIGINKTSTFAGFCRHHDNTLFESIDNAPLSPDRHQIALYAYRCVCREFFVKENAVKVLEAMKAHPGLDSRRRSFLASSLTGHSLGLEGLKHHKIYYDEALLGKDYDKFEYTYFTSTSKCSLQLSGQLYPDFDFMGKCVQDLGDWTSPLDLLTFFTAPTSDGWAFGFAWHVSSNRSCVPFIQSLASRVSGGERTEDALLRFVFSCCENHAFRISWWDRLSEHAQQAVVERMLLMAHPNIPVPSTYLVSGCEGVADWRFEFVHTTLRADA